MKAVQKKAADPNDTTLKTERNSAREVTSNQSVSSPFHKTSNFLIKIQGFTQTQQDEDDWTGTQGKKSRKERVRKEKVEKVLSGRDATDHYLQCYQLILWKQAHWLINSKGFPPELEVVVKDLWSLRIQGFYKDEERSAYGSTMFSSQSEGDGTDTDGTCGKSVSSRRSRMSAVHKEKLPKLIETLGLCYLGMVLLRLPVSLGEIYKWAAKEEMVYSRAVRIHNSCNMLQMLTFIQIKEIPKEMRMRLRPEYYSALEIRAELKGSRVYRTVLNLVEFYYGNFEMEFPPLNAPILIFNHIRDLALPSKFSISQETRSSNMNSRNIPRSPPSLNPPTLHLHLPNPQQAHPRNKILPRNPNNINDSPSNQTNTPLRFHPPHSRKQRRSHSFTHKLEALE